MKKTEAELKKALSQMRSLAKTAILEGYVDEAVQHAKAALDLEFELLECKQSMFKRLVAKTTSTAVPVLCDESGPSLCEQVARNGSLKLSGKWAQPEC